MCHAATSTTHALRGGGPRVAPPVWMDEAEAAPRLYVVALDTSEAANHVIDAACALAAASSRSAELHFVHVSSHAVSVAPMGLPVFVSQAGLAEAGERLLERAVARAGATFRGRIVAHLAMGEPWREITRAAARLGADLIVIGTVGRRGFARLALGSVAEKVIRHAGCSVFVVRPKQHGAAHAEPEPSH